MTKDMTEGNAVKLILRFMVPLVLGNLFQQLYNVADSVIVGRYLGVNALAGVGQSASLTFLILGFVNGCCSGFAIPVAQCFGAKQYSQMRRFVFNAEILSVILAAVITTGTAFFCDNILHLMGTPQEIYNDAYCYLLVIFLGIPFTFLFNMLSGIIRSLGDSKTPFIFLIISTLFNIAGDLIFIIVFKMGVLGAALATIMAQALSGVMCLFYMRSHYDILVMEPRDRKADPGMIKRLLGMGLPMGLQFSITAIGSIMLQSAINALGTVYVASYAAALKIKQLMMCPFDAIGATMATYCGQNLGAGKIGRIKIGIRSGVLIGVVYGAIAGVILYFFAGAMTTVFIDAGNIDVIEGSHQYLACIGAFYPALAFVIIMRNVIQGLGYSGKAFFSGVFEMIARTLMSLIAIPAFGWSAACYTDVVAWLSGSAFLVALIIFVIKDITRRQMRIEK
ncbi:MAG: MATE family efflux transporter [Lachnospiraceae bacterium]